jgi:hypothetical protein
MELSEYDPMRHHSIAYPMEVGAPKFELIPVEKQKDLMVNAARMHAEQEYNRIMELVKVLQKQAEDVKLRLDITDQVHKAEYKFQVYHGQCYWLARDTDANKPILIPLGPNDWSTGKPDRYQYIVQIKWLGDYTWMEVPGTRVDDATVVK